MTRTLPFVRYKRVLTLPHMNIITSSRSHDVWTAIQSAGLGEHFVTVRGDRTRGTIVRVLHIDDADPYSVRIDLEGTARADVSRVNGDGTAEIEELPEEPADPALLGAAHAALEELAALSDQRKAPGAHPLFLGGVRGLGSLKAGNDGVGFSFVWAVGAGLDDDLSARLLDLETNDRLRFIASWGRDRARSA